VKQIIAEMRAADVSPPIVSKQGRKPDENIVACALALHRGEKFDDDAAACRLFAVQNDNYDVRGVWVGGKLAQLRAYRQQQLAAELEAACVEWCAVAQAVREADREGLDYYDDSIYYEYYNGSEAHEIYIGSPQEHIAYQFAEFWAQFSGEQAAPAPDWCPPHMVHELSCAHVDFFTRVAPCESQLERVQHAADLCAIYTEDADVPTSFVADQLRWLEARQLTLPTPAHLAFWIWSKWRSLVRSLAPSERTACKYPIVYREI